MKKLLTITGIMLLLLAISNREQVAQTLDTLYQKIAAFGNMLVSLVLRSDSAGDGRYGASRSGGTRTHNGVDLVVRPGDDVFSPIDATVIRQGQVYGDDPNYKLLELQGKGEFTPLKMKVMYVDPIKSLIGNEVTRGEQIAFAQKISDKWGANMTDHIHVEMRWDGQLIDPTPFLLGTGGTA